MQKTLIIGLCLLVSFLTSEAQKAPTAQLLIKEIINLRDSFVSHKFDEESTLKSNSIWIKDDCDCSEAPPTVEEIKEIGVEEPKEVYKIQYPKHAFFQKRNVIGTQIAYDPEKKVCILYVHDEDNENFENIKSIVSFLEKKAKKISETDYLYSGNYFRITKHTSPYFIDLKIIAENKYPQGFEYQLLIRK